MILEVATRAADPYRAEAVSLVSVIPGTLASLDDADALHTAFAFMVAALGTAPLVAACVLGLAP